METTEATHQLPSFPSLNIQDSSNPAPCQCICTLQGHSSYISSLTVHRSSVYSGSSDRRIQIWTDLKPESSMTCKSPIKSLLISGNTMFSSHQDHKIRVWRINHTQNPPLRLQAVLPTIKDQILGLLSPNKHVQVRRHKKCMWVQHADVVSALAISSNQSLLYSVSWDRTIIIWRISDLKCIESIPKAHHDAINSVVVSKDGFIYTGSADKTVKVWKQRPDQKKHSLVDTLTRHGASVNALALGYDESVLYTGSCDRTVVVWERRDGGGHYCRVATECLIGHGGAVLCLATRGDLVCSGSEDRTVRVWRRGGGYFCLGVLEGHKGPVKSLVMVGGEACEDECSSSRSTTTSACLVYSGGLDCDIKVWNIW